MMILVGIIESARPRKIMGMDGMEFSVRTAQKSVLILSKFPDHSERLQAIMEASPGALIIVADFTASSSGSLWLTRM
jgi:hypothetical protein